MPGKFKFAFGTFCIFSNILMPGLFESVDMKPMDGGPTI